jgi:EAL domain-containing protein (putative c-di-GMP-specific phosphodiesterase class I)
MTAINNAHVYRFLMKPCAPEDLTLCIAQALEDRQRRMRYDGWRSTRSESSALRLGDAFERALEASYMVFQPIYESDGERLYGYECLVRCLDPDISQAGALIGLAEDLGRMHDLDRHVHALIAERIPEAAEDLLFLVNLHPNSITSSGLLGRGGPLDAFADRVVLEVTEGCALKGTDELHETLDALRDRGYRIALDDLGAGYAGLSSFALLSPDIVKLDMGLVRDVYESPMRCKLIQSMTTLCDELGILTIAEGIETDEECAKVVELGCDLLQGFLLAVPTQDLARPQAVRRLSGT